MLAADLCVPPFTPDRKIFEASIVERSKNLHIPAVQTAGAGFPENGRWGR